mmetsp:Transcript_32387/g.103266  ORF Transcript_32387/g.103266 Transcript_32387/m.103266 type:complete len:235 (+) Transcript_32387:274-978(+)
MAAAASRPRALPVVATLRESMSATFKRRLVFDGSSSEGSRALLKSMRASRESTGPLSNKASASSWSFAKRASLANFRNLPSVRRSCFEKNRPSVKTSTRLSGLAASTMVTARSRSSTRVAASTNHVAPLLELRQMARASFFIRASKPFNLRASDPTRAALSWDVLLNTASPSVFSLFSKTAARPMTASRRLSWAYLSSLSLSSTSSSVTTSPWGRMSPDDSPWTAISTSLAVSR